MDTDKHVIGDQTTIKFIAWNSKAIPCKVDSGATTSCLHATDIKVNGDSVTFNCPPLSDRQITMSVVGQQEVHSADGGANDRPVVQTDVEVDGQLIKNAEFNLNDRSNMDVPILLGQNLLKAGNFVIDISHDSDQSQPEQLTLPEDQQITDEQVLEALQVIARSNITIQQLIQYMATEAINRI